VNLNVAAKLDDFTNRKLNLDKPVDRRIELYNFESKAENLNQIMLMISL